MLAAREEAEQKPPARSCSTLFQRGSSGGHWRVRSGGVQSTCEAHAKEGEPWFQLAKTTSALTAISNMTTDRRQPRGNETTGRHSCRRSIGGRSIAYSILVVASFLSPPGPRNGRALQMGVWQQQPGIRSTWRSGRSTEATQTHCSTRLPSSPETLLPRPRLKCAHPVERLPLVSKG